MKLNLTTAAAILALTATGSASAAATTVWNVTVSNQDLTGYQGAATENAATGSTWNAVSDTSTATLIDSTNDGSGSAGVTFKLTPAGGSAIDFGGQNVAGDDIFDTWIKDNGNNDLFDVTFGGLNAAATYDLVVYSDWFWGPNSVPVTQTGGTGLTGTFNINSAVAGGGGNGTVGPLLEDTNALNTPSGDTNYARFDGLSSDLLGNLSLSMGGVDGPINGFQLVEVVPEPSSLALLGLGGLCVLRRRRGETK